MYGDALLVLESTPRLHVMDTCSCRIVLTFVLLHPGANINFCLGILLIEDSVYNETNIIKNTQTSRELRYCSNYK